MMTDLSLDEALPDSSFLLDEHAESWRDAIRAAGRGLVASGFATPEYTAEMIAAVEGHGPYIVIAPGLALAHSRPSPAVLRTGMSWVHLATPVEFGNPRNDPVTLVIGLAATDEEQHINVLAMLSRSLGRPDVKEQLENASSPRRVRSLLTGSSQ